MSINIIAKTLLKAKNIDLFCHTNPDGDTLGSAAALALALQSLNKTVGLYCDNPITSKYRLLTCAGLFKLRPEERSEVAVAIDCGDLSRVGQNAQAFFRAATTINIDHHFSNNKFAQINLVEKTASTAQIVLKLIKTLNVKLTKEIADALFIGLATDTGSFQHSNTDESVFVAAAELAAAGANVSDIAFDMFKKSPLNRTKLLGEVLSRMRIYADGKIALVYCLDEDFQKFDVEKSATESFVDYAIGIEGAVVGVAVCSYTENVYKISMRSKSGMDVSAICNHFGGGGHKQAAGCIVSGLFEDVVEKIVRQIEFEL